MDIGASWVGWDEGEVLLEGASDEGDWLPLGDELGVLKSMDMCSVPG